MGFIRLRRAELRSAGFIRLHWIKRFVVLAWALAVTATLATMGLPRRAARASSSGVDLQGDRIATAGGDTTPPTVVLLSPDGGETYQANAPALVQWTAFDASGIAAIDLYFSDDAGINYHPIAIGLANTGSHTWFPANRPTELARVRVVAVDAAFNQATDSSEGLFTVQSPAGGVVPTTLRDFDQPGSQPFDADTIRDPATCAACHGYYDAAVEPYFNWRGSMMAQASRDPLFEACLAVANQDAPDSGDLCLRCHIPKGWLAGRSVPTSGGQVQASDEIGVSCDLCHRLVDPFFDSTANPPVDADILAALAQAPVDFGNGMYVVDPTGMRRGPFADATSGHAILVSPFHREAGLCGTCHDVSNPAFEKDEHGNYVPNAFDEQAASFSPHSLMPIERTYSEWLYSAYNSSGGIYAPEFGGNRDYVATCQDCHMRDVTGKGCNMGSAPTRTDLPLHDLTGGSTWLPGLLATLYPAEVDAAAMQAAVTRARYMLQHAAGLEAQQTGDELRVTVTNKTGHKLPTGYPEGRRMWLNVKFYDASAVLLSESGAYDDTTGELERDAEAKVYEAELGLDAVMAALVGKAEGPSFHFVLNNKVFKDNRIPPQGFSNANYSLFGGQPVGATYADGQYWDDTTYAIPAGAVSAELTLFYQSTSKEYVEFLRDENVTNDRGQFLFDLWNANGKCPPEVMQTLTMPLLPPWACCLPDGTCENLDQAACLANDGESQPGAGCTGAEACCFAGHVCLELAPVCCLSDGGVSQGPSSACLQTMCPECLDDADCDDSARCTLDRCESPGGTCSHTPLALRYGDIYPPDGDGIVELGDVLLLLAAYADTDPCDDVPYANLIYGGQCPVGCTGGSECVIGTCAAATDECCDLIELGDVLAILDAYAGNPPCADPCPP